LEAPRGWKERADQGAQKPFKPAQEQPKVVAGSGEHGVAAVAVSSFEMIAAHPVLSLDVPDDRLDGGAATHLAADKSRSRTPGQCPLAGFQAGLKADAQ
jgi:hypothetical protein